MPLALLCGLLYLRTPDPSLLLGVVYGSALSMRLPLSLSVRDLFPLVMLFIFLLVLNESPTRLFTVSLIFTTRALIVFRGMIITLVQIQSSKKSVEKNQVTWVTGLTFEFLLSAILVYSTFRPVMPEILDVDRTLVGGVLIVVTCIGMPYWIFGLILGALSFLPMTRNWAIIGFGLLAFYESNFSPRSRNTAARVLPEVP